MNYALHYTNPPDIKPVQGNVSYNSDTLSDSIEMQNIAKEAIANFMPEESHLWARISELEVCIRQMCNNALDLGYCDMRDCKECKTFKVCGVER